MWAANKIAHISSAQIISHLEIFNAGSSLNKAVMLQYFVQGNDKWKQWELLLFENKFSTYYNLAEFVKLLCY